MAALTIDHTKVRVDEFYEPPMTSIASVDIDAGEIVRLDATFGFRVYGLPFGGLKRFAFIENRSQSFSA